MTAPATVLVPPARVVRWVENFAARHGEATLVVRDAALAGEAGAHSAPGEGGGWRSDESFGCATLIRLRHLLPPAGEGTTMPRRFIRDGAEDH